MKRRLSRIAAALLATAALGTAVPGALAQTFVPVTQQMLENPDPADWLMMSRTYDAHHYSPLDQINKSNVGTLRMAWSRGLPDGTQESTPLVYRGVMYLYVPGAGVMAVDATTGDQIWEYKRSYPENVRPRAARNKSLAIYQDMIYFGAPDGRAGGARRQDRGGPLGDQGRPRRPDGGRADRGRRQGHLEPHLPAHAQRADDARQLLHRGA